MKARAALASRFSFTLVEVLTAIVILSLLILLIFSIVGSALKISDTSGRGANSAIEAKEVLDSMGSDLAGMLVRPDVDALYDKADGNDKMFFYSQQTGFFGAAVSSANRSSVTLVGYRINTSDNPSGQPMLERLAQGLTWDVDPNNTTQPLAYLTFGTKTSVINYPAVTGGTISGQWPTVVGTAANNYDDGGAYTSGGPSYYDGIGSQVFRLEICFQLANGTFSLYPGFTNSAPVYPASITNTVAVVVAIASLDRKAGDWCPLPDGARSLAP